MGIIRLISWSHPQARNLHAYMLWQGSWRDWVYVCAEGFSVFGMDG